MATSIRCPSPAPHGIYDDCGSLLGIIDKDITYFRCPSCRKNSGKWVKVYRDEDGGLVMKKMPPNFTADFADDEIKRIED